MQTPFIEIAGRRISVDDPPYIIAELSANHNGNIENAFRILDEAKKAGADAVKLQTYRPDTILSIVIMKSLSSRVAYGTDASYMSFMKKLICHGIGTSLCSSARGS